MIIKELIEELEKYPEDATVIRICVSGWDNDVDEVEEVVFKDGKVKLY